jgi:hypothetical protein
MRQALGRIGLAIIVLFSIARALGWVWPAAFDLHAYWVAGTVAPYLSAHAGDSGAYLYSPAFTQLFELLRLLPWGLVLGIWTAVALLILRWMAPRTWPILLPVFVLEIVMGNIQLFLAAMVIVGFRWPGVWAFALLTKVTPGIGLLWFAVRREWRNLAIALGVTAAVASVSFVIAPGLWSQWIAALTANAQASTRGDALVPISIWARLPVAAAVVVWGARTDRRWTVPVAVLLATPILWTVSLFVVLVAVLPLSKKPRPTRDDVAAARSAPARAGLAIA